MRCKTDTLHSPDLMNNLFRISAVALCAFVGTTFADEFKSKVIPGDGGVTSQLLAHVQDDQFMFIRNFTQENNASITRGVVTVTKHATTADVLVAALLDPTSPPEIINDIVIAGPADVSVTCGAPSGSNCFISYKKEGN
jgi:hypothetical protein